MEIKGGAKYALVEIKHGGMQTSSYRTLEELIASLLSSNGEEFPKKVRDEIIPRVVLEYESEDEESEGDEDIDDIPPIWGKAYPWLI